MQITVTHEVPEEDIASLFITAFEGGSNYWLDSATVNIETQEVPWYADPDIYSNLDMIMSLEEDEGQKHEINLTTIEDGLKTMAKDHASHFSDFRNESYDAITGDVFLQCCLFGEVQYG